MSSDLYDAEREDVQNDDATIRQRFNRRFVFGLHTLISGILATILFLLAFTHPLNYTLWNGSMTWAGFARPDLMYASSLLLGAIGAHGLWLLWREGRLRGKALLFWGHTLLLLEGLALTFSYLTSWYFDETYKWADFYTPASPGPPPAILLYLLFLVTAIALLTFPIHGIVMTYRMLLARSLRRWQLADEKAKRGEMEFVVGDDGELMDWVEAEMKAKRLL